MLCILGGPSAQLSNCLAILCATGALIKKQVFLRHQSDEDMAQVQDIIRLNHCCMSQNLGVNTSQDIKRVSDRNFYLKPGDPGLLPSEPYPGFTHVAEWAEGFLEKEKAAEYKKYNRHGERKW